MKLPDEFIEQLQGLLPDTWEQLTDAIVATEPSVAVRVNDARGVGAPEGARRVPWCGQGFYLQDRPSFTFDTDWHAGHYYVQDASSMFIAHVIRHLVSEPVRYLDLCAAPGGKTTAAIQALPQRSLVVANEIVPPVPVCSPTMSSAGAIPAVWSRAMLRLTWENSTPSLTSLLPMCRAAARV